jgi:hypothetical protein
MPPSTFAGAIEARAEATPAIVAILGSGDKIYRGLVPQPTPDRPDAGMPYVELHEIGNPVLYRTTGGHQVKQPRVQAVFCAKTDATTVALLGAWRQTFHGAMDPPLDLAPGIRPLPGSVEIGDDYLGARDELSPGGVRQYRRIVEMTALLDYDPPA